MEYFPKQRDTIWISCEGENPADIEYLGPIRYFPKVQGFPGYYYPFENTEGYLSPLVAVQFERPLGKDPTLSFNKNVIYIVN